MVVGAVFELGINRNGRITAGKVRAASYLGINFLRYFHKTIIISHKKFPSFDFSAMYVSL